MIQPLSYIITINGKEFYRDGKHPESRIDIEYKKPKMKEIKMCITKEQLDAYAVKVKDAYGNHPAYPNVSPEQLDEIIKGIGHELVC